MSIVIYFSFRKYLTYDYSSAGCALGTGLASRRKTGTHLAHVRMIVWWGKAGVVQVIFNSEPLHMGK